MRKLLIVTHGNFAKGIAQTLTMFLGENQPFYAISAYVDETPLKKQLDEFMDSVNDSDQLVILTDILGGSVNQQMIPYMQRSNTYLITGINLAILLALSCLPQDASIDDFRHLIEEGRNSVYLMNDYEFTISEDGDE